MRRPWCLIGLIALVGPTIGGGCGGSPTDIPPGFQAPPLVDPMAPAAGTPKIDTKKGSGPPPTMLDPMKAGKMK